MKKIYITAFPLWLIALMGFGFAQPDPQDSLTYPNGLILEDLGKNYLPNMARVPAYLFHTRSNTSGTTSVRRQDAENLRWKDEGYYQRNRELGQVFNIPADTSIQIDAIVLRTGNSSSAVLEGTPGSEVQIQIFEVIGTPVINDNGTPQGTNSTHGFSTNHRTDDFLDGITYETLAIIKGGIFPDIPPTTQNGGEEGHLRYIRWDLQGDAELTLEGGKRYAFMVGFSSNGPQKGFSIGNDNRASSTDVPELRKDVNGNDWWCIRREGDGTLPPTQVPGDNPPTDETIRQQLVDESLFEEEHELGLTPTTDGFPDVDTYRTFEFYMEVVNSCPAAGTPCDDGDSTTVNDQADGECGCYGEVPGGCQASGFITYKRYDETGTSANLNSLKNSPKFPDNPDEVLELELFEAPSNVAENYGATMSGFVCVPLTGEYTFWIAGDDNVELNLSTDADPANIRRIAYHGEWTQPREWTRFETQQSDPVFLRAGQSYYIEALMKEGQQGDHFAVGWLLPNGVLQRPIPGKFLSITANCPAAGTPCDDGNPNTINDIADGACGCAGTNTCPPAGTACDDGMPFTENDVQDGECGCMGETVYATGLSVTDLGTSYQRDPVITPDYLFFDSSDMGGSTSVRRVESEFLSWKTAGYFQRNRDLGQTFYIPEDTTITLDAIVLRTGNSASAVKIGAISAEVYLQLFEVTGEPVINDNGTPVGTSSTHGFTDNHRADDYLEGVTYESLLAVSGGFFPIIGPTTMDGGQEGHLHYIRWDLQDENELTLEGGKRYAFMVGFIEPNVDRSFTLGNVNRANNPAAPELSTDTNGQPWWSMRREGDGTLPPTQYPGNEPPADPALVEQLVTESTFENAHAYLLSPTTNGFPDVDTYRTLEFYIEAKSTSVSNRHQITVGPKLLLYPNPTEELFHISFTYNGPFTTGDVTLVDMSGRIVSRQVVDIQNGSNKIKIDTKKLGSTGLLQVMLLTGQQLSTGTILIK